MQFQGCSAYCGLCALNNAYSQEMFTVEQLDNIAELHLGMSLINELQIQRDISGFYSVQALCKAVSEMGDALVDIDLTVKLIVSENVNQDNFLTEFVSKVNPYSCLEKAKSLYMFKHSFRDSMAS